MFDGLGLQVFDVDATVTDGCPDRRLAGSPGCSSWRRRQTGPVGGSQRRADSDFRCPDRHPGAHARPREDVFEPVCNWRTAPPWATLSPTDHHAHFVDAHRDAGKQFAQLDTAVGRTVLNGQGDFRRVPVSPSAKVRGRLKGSGLPSSRQTGALGRTCRGAEGCHA